MVTVLRQRGSLRRRVTAVAVALGGAVLLIVPGAPAHAAVDHGARVVGSSGAGAVSAAGTSAAGTSGQLPQRLPAGLQVPATAPPLPAGVSATAWAVVDLDTGRVLAAKDAHAQLAPASTLKILTALSLLPVVPPSAAVTATQADANVDGSKVGLLPGVPYPAEELYTALLLVSGNDAAQALADAAGGTDHAVALMNAEAARLGATDTHAATPHGLDAPGQVSTPYDLAVLARAALGTPDIARWASTQRSSMTRAPGQPTYEIDNHNRLLGRYPGAIGLKNGYTVAAQASFVGAAQRGGHRVVVTLMRDQPNFWAEATALLDWGFADLAAGGPAVGQLPVRPGQGGAAVPPAAPAPGSRSRSSGAGQPASGGSPDAAATGAPSGSSGGAGGRPAAAAGSSSGQPLALPGRQAAGALLVVGAGVALRPRRRLRGRPRP